MERFILPKSKEGIIASTREKARKRQALCRIKKRNEQSLIPTTSNHLEDTGNKQFASTSNHLEDTENQEQIPTQDTFGAISKYNFFSDPISIKTNQIPRIILPKCAIQRTLNLPKSIKTNEILRIILPKCTIQQNLNLPKSIETNEVKNFNLC
ncbi:unnamed protein product [Gordionus sp. m RMFG-2023]